MMTDSGVGLTALEHLSALADGELGDAEVAHTCQQWRVDVELRSSWHAFQLIGDVLRSEDLASPATHDFGFLTALRTRLADEPVVLAPSILAPSILGPSVLGPSVLGPSERPVDPRSGASTAAARRRRWVWMAPSAVAAGFIAVAGVALMPHSTDSGAGTAARGAAPALAATAGDALRPVSVGVESVADPRSLVASGKLIRDVRLDRYLSAHKAFAGSSALGVPSGFLRNATADAADR